MKDWKAECDKLRGELAEARRQLDYERSYRERRQREEDDLRDTLKKLLLHILER